MIAGARTAQNGSRLGSRLWSGTFLLSFVPVNTGKQDKGPMETKEAHGLERSGTFPVDLLKYLKQHFQITTFVRESGTKLKLPTVATSAACVLYHRFFQQCKPEEFDAHTVAASALYLASKSEESPRKLRDTINVCYRSCHKESPPLEVGPKYWEIKDSMVNCELLMLRVLKFNVTVDNAHKYLLHYLKSLEHWIDQETWSKYSLAQLSWSFLQDSFHLPLCLHHPPSYIAVAMVYFATQCLGFRVPSDGAQKPWWQVLCSDCKEEDIHCIIEKMMDLYSFENKAVG